DHAQTRPLDDVPDRDADRERKRDDEEAIRGIAHETKGYRGGELAGQGVRLALDPETQAHRVLDEDRQAEGEEEAVQRIERVEPPEQEALADRPAQTDRERRDEERGPPRPTSAACSRRRRAAARPSRPGSSRGPWSSRTSPWPPTRASPARAARRAGPSGPRDARGRCG